MDATATTQNKPSYSSWPGAGSGVEDAADLSYRGDDAELHNESEEWREHTRLWNKPTTELESLQQSKGNIWASPQASPRHVSRSLGRSLSGDSGGPEQDSLMMSPHAPTLPHIGLEGDHEGHSIPMYHQVDSPGAGTTTSSYSYVYSSNNSIPGLLPASSGSTQGSSHGGSRVWYQPQKQSIVLQSAPGRFGGGGPGRHVLPQETAMSSLAKALASSDRSAPAPPPGFFSAPPLAVDEELTEFDEDTEADLDYSTASLDPTFLREVSSPGPLQRQGSRGYQQPHSASKAISSSSSASLSSSRRSRGKRGASRPKQQHASSALHFNRNNTLKPHNAAPRGHIKPSSLTATLESSFSSRPRNGSSSIRLGSDSSSAAVASAAAAAAATLDGSVGLASSSEAIRQLLKPGAASSGGLPAMPSHQQSLSALPSYGNLTEPANSYDAFPILPQTLPDDYSLGVDDPSLEDFLLEDDDSGSLAESTGSSGRGSNPYGEGSPLSPRSKKREWLLRMNRKLELVSVGELDPAWPITAIMNAWAKTKSAQGASMVEMWLNRVQQESDAGNDAVVPTTKMYTMAVDAWANSGEGGAAAQRAEKLLQQMYELYKSGGQNESLRPTTGVFNAVIKAWANSREKIAPARAEQILDWMQALDLDVQPDKFTLNTTMHAFARAGGPDAAKKAQEILARMQDMYREGNTLAKPDTISYNIVLNAIAKSGGKGAAEEAERLLETMHALHEQGDPDVKPNVVSYGAVIDCFSKCGEPDAASRADNLLASMIKLHQTDPIRHADLLPNTYVFNCCLNCWAKSKEPDAASKAEEMLMAMGRLYATGMDSVKPDAFSYTACIDAWSKSGYRGAAVRAEQLLDKMEAKYLAGDTDLKPNTYTYNAVISALAKSGETGAAARAERVLQNMVNRQRAGGSDAVKPTTINILDAWAKSGGGRAAAERAEEILEWMDRLHKSGNKDVKPDTISFNAIIDAWARSGDRIAPRRAEQILDHMDELYLAGNKGVKPDTYTYNTLINCWAKSGERGAATRAEHVLSVMEQRYRDGDRDFKPNTRTMTSVIDAHAKSGEKGAARRAEQIFNSMISRYEATGDPDSKPNVHTANAVCNACAFSKNEEDRTEALEIAFRVYDWLSNHPELEPDSYTYTILLSVCANLLPRDDSATRFAHARAFFESCREGGYVNDYVLGKLRQTLTDDEFLLLVGKKPEESCASVLPRSWTRNAKLDVRSRNKGRNSSGSRNGGGSMSWTRRR